VFLLVFSAKRTGPQGGDGKKNSPTNIYGDEDG